MRCKWLVEKVSNYLKVHSYKTQSAAESTEDTHFSIKRIISCENAVRTQLRTASSLNGAIATNVHVGCD